MDYLGIVFNGFTNPNSQEYLESYFFREFKKAEKDHFEADEFFNGCVKVVEALERAMDERLSKRKNELYFMLDSAETGNSNFAGKDDTKTHEQRCKERVADCENELIQIGRHNFPVNLLHFTSNRFVGQFYESDALIIREAISKARVKAFPLNEKIEYYKEQKWNIPFRQLHHTITTVCEWVKPIYPTIEPLYYIEYFFNNIDFDKIDNEATKKETLKYCNAIYYGLEQLLKADISKEILNYQNSISKLSKEKVQETQIKLVELIGNLNRQARTNEPGISFSHRYNSLYKSIEQKERLFPIDYQILISHFNETFLNDLLSSYEIINETFKEITPLLTAIPPQQTERSNRISNPVIALFCSVVNDAGIITKGEAESVEDYCKKVCTEFNLTYTDKVRQGFLTSNNQRNITKVKNLILPIIPSEKSSLISNYLENKQPTNQKLYS